MGKIPASQFFQKKWTRRFRFHKLFSPVSLHLPVCSRYFLLPFITTGSHSRLTSACSATSFFSGSTSSSTRIQLKTPQISSTPRPISPQSVTRRDTPKISRTLYPFPCCFRRHVFFSGLFSAPCEAPMVTIDDAPPPRKEFSPPSSVLVAGATHSRRTGSYFC